ncbi:MAG: PilZ domain-containing protein [Planctomycetota bacterium]|nr:PilZ domain-containing protein [Planctomycetota bacterium]
MPVSVDAGKVVLYQPTDEQRAAAQRAERHNLAVEVVSSRDLLPTVLTDPAQGVLVLCSYTPEARAAARALRAPKGWRSFPVFAIVPDELIDAHVLKQANECRIELLPTSLPEARRWEKLRAAHETVRSGRRWTVLNQRSHFRLPLKAKATLLADAETVDISEGGMAFLTNATYHVGDTGRVDVRSLLGDMEADERGFPFQVVSVKTLKQGGYRYIVGAQFADLSDDARRRLKTALELIEPTETEY